MIPAAFALTGATQQGHDVAQVPLGVTLLFMALLMAMILCLALEEKLHAKKSVIVGLFAVVTLFLGAAFDLLPFGSVSVGGHEIDLPVYVPAIDWNVIAIILGSSLFVDVTSRSGLFTWIAIKLTRASGGDPLKLLVYYGVMTVVFSAVLNNVTAMIIVGSLTGVSLNRLARNNLEPTFRPKGLPQNFCLARTLTKMGSSQLPSQAHSGNPFLLQWSELRASLLRPHSVFGVSNEFPSKLT